MADEQKKNKHAQNAEVFMWLVFICCGMVIAFVDKNKMVTMFPMQGTQSRIPSLINGLSIVAALLMCFPPLHRRMLQNSMSPLIDVCKRGVAAFALVAVLKGVFG